MPSIIKELPKVKPYIVLSKTLFSIAMVSIFFVLPCVLISEYQETGNLDPVQGKVAGVSTSSLNSVVTNSLNPQAIILTLVGITLLCFSLLISLFIFRQNSKSKKKFKY